MKEGKQITIAKDRAKNKSSHRALPLVPVFRELLLRLLEEQQKNKLLYKKSYSDEYADYIYVNKLGERIKPGYITQHFPIVLEKHNMRRIRFHDRRHRCPSLLLANGVGMKEIQKWLGNSHYSTAVTPLEPESRTLKGTQRNSCFFRGTKKPPKAYKIKGFRRFASPFPSATRLHGKASKSEQNFFLTLITKVRAE